MREIITALDEALQRDQPVALAIVVETKGASPAQVGFKLLVRPDDSVVGNLGGGALEQRQFYVERLIHDLRDLGPELRSLTQQGFVAEDAAIPGGWRVRPGAFLWWLADELVRTVRDEPSFEEWLRRQEWGGLLTRGEKQQLDKGVRAVVGLLKGGVTTLIKAAAKGAGEAMVKGE